MSYPKVTIQSIEAKVKGCEYICPAGGTMTICVLTLENGFQVTGESACVSIQNFNADLGQEFARKAAIEKIWALEGYLMKQAMELDSAKVPAELASDPLTE